MSISGVGAYGSAGLDQILTRMLSRLDNTSGTTSNTSSNSSTTTTGSASATPESAASSALTGTSQSSLSDQIMALLVQLQQQSAADGTQGATNPNASTATQTTATNDPIQQLFSAMDVNGDGVVSQAEMESYIQGKGGTQAQADALFSALNQNSGGQNGSAGISEQQLAADVSQAQHSGHHHHHHHGGPESGQASANSSSDIASQIFSALDTNKDGKVSAAEFSTAINTSNSTSSNGTSSNGPSTLFAQIDSNGDGSVTPNELGNFLTSLAKQAQSDVSTLGAFAQLATQSYDVSASLMNKAGAGQSSYA